MEKPILTSLQRQALDILKKGATFGDSEGVLFTPLNKASLNSLVAIGYITKDGELYTITEEGRRA